MQTTDHIYCEAGHHWDRPKSRGQRPKFCPKHRPPVASGVQTLTCAAGHQWTRPAQKGMPPQYCAEHKPVREVKPKKVREPTNYSLIDVAALKRRLGDYLSDQVATDLRALEWTDFKIQRSTEPSDISYHQETQKVWMRQLARDADMDLSDVMTR